MFFWRSSTPRGLAADRRQKLGQRVRVVVRKIQNVTAILGHTPVTIFHEVIQNASLGSSSKSGSQYSRFIRDPHWGKGKELSAILKTAAGQARLRAEQEQQSVQKVHNKPHDKGKERESERRR